VPDTAEATVVVATAKLAAGAPAGTVTLAGTVATAGRLFDRGITAPPAGAGPLSVIVPVAELPPPIVFGFTTTDATITGGCSTLRFAT
jgi:hypothetical protein